MVYCIVPGCYSHSIKGRHVISFHQLPSDDQRRDEWLKRINRQGETEGSDYIPSQFACVCGLHFSEDAFSQTSLRVRVLTKTAVPTIFPQENTPRQHTKKIKKIAVDESKQTVGDRVEDLKIRRRFEDRVEDSYHFHYYKKLKAKQQFQTITDKVSEKEVKPSTSSHALNPIDYSSITDNLSLNMTHVRFPVSNNTDSRIPATVKSELNSLHRVPETANSSDSLFQTPVLIIEDIVSEEELGCDDFSFLS